jgi:hypothetical protein
MSTSALRAALEPGELHRLARTAASPSATPAQRAGAAALLEVLAGANVAPSGSPPAPATMPIPQVVTDLHQVLSPSTLSALAQLDERQRAKALADELASEDAWADWEHDAAMMRPAGCGPLDDHPPADELAWLAGGYGVDDVRLGYGDSSTTVATTGFGAHH